MIPSKDQLIELISNGDNAKNNSLILNPRGFFELRNFSSLDINNDKSIVVRFETLGMYTDSVGKDAASDKHFIDNMYISMLEGWICYLKTNEINWFTDTPQGRNEAELIAEIEKIVS